MKLKDKINELIVNVHNTTKGNAEELNTITKSVSKLSEYAEIMAEANKLVAELNTGFIIRYTEITKQTDEKLKELDAKYP